MHYMRDDANLREQNQRHAKIGLTSPYTGQIVEKTECADPISQADNDLMIDHYRAHSNSHKGIQRNGET
jgi:hypothetical protein